jgi:hypothetical protein
MGEKCKVGIELAKKASCSRNSGRRVDARKTGVKRLSLATLTAFLRNPGHPAALYPALSL